MGPHKAPLQEGRCLFLFFLFFMVDVVSYGVLARNLRDLPLCDSRKNYIVGPSVSLNAKQEKVLAVVCYS
jgi:hypothetical protein